MKATRDSFPLISIVRRLQRSKRPGEQSERADLSAGRRPLLGDSGSAAVGRLAIEVRGAIFGFAVENRLPAAQALDVEQGPAAMLVDWSFAWEAQARSPVRRSMAAG